MNNLDRIFNMDIEDFSREYFDYLKRVLDGIDTASIRRFVEVLIDCRDRETTVFFIGNGGSAATASHFANDLSIGTNAPDKPFKVMSLTDNVSVLTALGNDFGYDEIFIRQLKVYGKAGDVLVGISASGNSKNLVKCFDFAADVGIQTVAITAFDGGIIKSMADYNVHVPTELNEYGPAEDAHMILDHLISSYLMRAVKNG